MCVCCTHCVFIYSRTVFVSEFHISSILYCIFILCITVTNLALWLQDLNKLTYLLTYLLVSFPLYLTLHICIAMYRYQQKAQCWQEVSKSEQIVNERETVGKFQSLP